MNIIKAEFSDLPAILELQKLCYRENAGRYNDFTIAPMTQTIEELQNDFRTDVILKAEENGKIIGSIRAFEKERTCFIGRVIVRPDFQNRGIGKKLMADIEKAFPEASRFELFTGHKDEKKLYFYKSLGYKIFKEEAHGDKVRLVFLEKLKDS